MWFATEHLARLGREGLLALCEKHNITDCFEPSVKSDGKQILSLEKELRIPNIRDFGRWFFAPDGRTILVTSHDPKNRVPTLHIFDLQAGNFTRQTIELSGVEDSSVLGLVFSPDGTYAAARLHGPASKDRIGYVVVSMADLRPVLLIGTKKDQCEFGHAMIFSANSKSLWINCNASRFRNRFLAAMKINIASAKVEKRVGLDTPFSDQISRFSLQKLARHNENVVLVGTSESFGSDDQQYNDRSRKLTSVLAFELESKRLYFEPISFPVGEKSGYSTSALVTAHNNDLSRIVLNIHRHPLNVEKGKPQQTTKSVEVWNTQTSTREHTLWSGPVKLRDVSKFGVTAGLGKTDRLLIFRRIEHSKRKTLEIFDLRTGKMLQEYGPLKIYEFLQIDPSGKAMVLVGKSALQVFKFADKP